MGVKFGLSHRSINKVKLFGEQTTKMYILTKGDVVRKFSIETHNEKLNNL